MHTDPKAVAEMLDEGLSEEEICEILGITEDELDAVINLTNEGIDYLY